MDKKPVQKKPVKRPVAKKKAEPEPHKEKQPKHEETPVAKTVTAKLTHGKTFYALGRRKTAVAQAQVTTGSGAITINELPFEKYFMSEDLRSIVQQPLVAVGLEKSLNVRGKIHGGGIHAQAESLRHAITRGIVLMDGETRRTLKKRGFLTRDPRVKERKKPGLKRARRAPQFSKR